MKRPSPAAPYRAAAGGAAPRAEVGWLDRSPARMAASDGGKELLKSLSATLRSLYRGLRRHAVYLADDGGRLVPPWGTGGEDRRGARDLLVLRSRLRANGQRGRAGVHLFPAWPGARDACAVGALLLDGRAAIGAILVEVAPPARFGNSDLAALEGIAALFSLSLQRLCSGPGEGKHAYADLDRRLAGQVQRRLVCASLPADAGVTVDARYLPALEVGGDFYELDRLGDGTIGGTIGDVSGKGVSAALIMSRVSSDLRRMLQSGARPSAVLGSLNAGLPDLDGETFVTASCFRLDARRREMTVANAGHIPLLVRRATGGVSTHGFPSGTPLGMMPTEYADEAIRLEPRDIVLLMTDGLCDALDRPSDRLGTERLLRIVGSAPHDPKAINTRILDAVGHTRRARSLDDMTLVALQLAS